MIQKPGQLLAFLFPSSPINNAKVVFQFLLGIRCSKSRRYIDLKSGGLGGKESRICIIGIAMRNIWILRVDSFAKMTHS